MEKPEEQAVKLSENMAKKMAKVAHRYDHADRVRKTAVELAKSEKLSGRELFLVEIAALWHDIGLDYVDDRSRHPEKSAEIFLNTFLDVSIFSEQEKMTVMFLLKYHDKYQQTKLTSSDEKLLNLLRILVDADTLELLGQRGYERAVETAKLRNWPEYDKEKPLGETYGFSAKQFDERFNLKRVGKLLNATEPTLVGQINFQISCSDLLFTNAAKRISENGVQFLKNKIQEITN